MTAAEKRSAEVKATRAPRGPKQVAAPAPWEREVWVDDGPLRDAAEQASSRAQQVLPPGAPADGSPRRVRRPAELDPEVVAGVEHEVGQVRAAKYKERLTAAGEALGRGRFDDARRMVQSVLRDAPKVAMAHEVAGLAFYSTGQWRKAVAELERARELDHSVRHHAVLMDCYRALRKYDVVRELWADLKAASPAPALMAEGRIVAAGALADQGRINEALVVLDRATQVPKKVREHHLRQWYVLGDLHDRAGNMIEARRFFSMVAHADREFADVVARLAALGR